MISRLACSFLVAAPSQRSHLQPMDTMWRQVCIAFVCLLVTCALAIEASAQSGVSTGSILGFVTDASGAVVPGAEVAITSNTGYRRTATSLDDGSYRALLLPPGNYEVSASRSGFKTFVRKGLVLAVDQNLRVDVSLTLGEVTESVTVEGSAIQVDTHSAQTSSVVSEGQIEALPLGGHRYLAAVSTSPGVIPAAQRIGVLPNPYVGWLFGLDSQGAGGQNKATDYQIDSSSTRMGIWGGAPTLPTSVGIAEVKVIRNQFSAEYGNGSTMVVNAVTKGGTSQFHGSLFDILGNDKFNSRLFRSGSVKPRVRYNQFGGDIGGPVIIPHLYDGKEKTYFYFNYEGIEQPGATLISGGIPPTVAQKNGDFSALSTPIIDPVTRTPFPGNIIPSNRLDPVTKYLTDKMPAANFGNQYRENFSTPSSGYEYTIRIDQNLGSKNRLFGRWWRSIPENRTVNGTLIILPEQTYDQVARNYSFTLNNTYTFSATVLNQTTFAMTDAKQLRENPPDTPFVDFEKLGIKGWNPDGAVQTAPAFNVPAYNLSVGTVGPTQMYDSNYIWSNTLTWIRGRHNLKFGFDYGRWKGRYSLGPEGNGQSPGVFTFNGSFTGNGMADFVLGRPSNLNKTNLQPIPLVSNKYGAFVQDDFKLSRKLTLNLGIRYRIEGPYVHEQRYGGVFIPNQQSTVIPNAPLGLNFVGDRGVPDTFYPTDYNDWAPRVGFAYDPTGNGRTAIRGGFGIYYNVGDWAPAYFTAQQQPYGQVVDMVPASLADPFAGITNPYPYSFDPAKITFKYPVSLSPTLSNSIRSAYVQTWSLGVQQQVKGVLLEVNYVGNSGHHLMSTGHINPARYIPGTDANGNPLSTLQNLNQRRIIQPAPGTYGAIILNSDWGNSNYNALQMSGRGHLTENLLLTTAWTWGHSLDAVTWGRSVDTFDTSNPFDRSNDKGNSDFDYRHIFTASLVWDLPRLTSMPGFVRAVLGNWQTSTMFNALTGPWVTVFSGVDRSLSGVGSDRADVLLTRSDFVNAAAETRGQKYDAYVNKPAFGLNPIGTFGNAGRNSLNVPGGWTADMSIQKRFPIRESVALNFRADFYNAFNHTRLNGGVFNGRSSLFPVSSPSFGMLTTTQSGRIIQFKMALTF